MRSDHLADGVCIYETSEEYEGDEVVVEDLGVEPEVGRDQSPGEEEGDEAEERTAGFVAAGVADFDDVLGTIN